MVGRRAYDFMYRTWAPWEGGPRDELVGLVTSGRIAPGRAIDLGCGSGANSIFLAEHGFDVTGVDYSPVGLEKARRATPPSLSISWLPGDLTAASIPGVSGTFDLLVDYSVLDDMSGPAMEAMAATVLRLSHPGSVFLMWCFYDEISWWKRRGGRFPGLAVGAEQRLFGSSFDIERLPEPAVGSGYACFVMTRA
ncbi:methyltransferase domain-containing protein [Lentzea sp. BCCO 10_0856]|uniref:Methyltransferase domain-containing protein n=1 Tax=Lentzea miocenica TaxID=3095431 RepID=A0ABU4SUV6_9PSEU|nr:methyltransferase domain-containing protein [Lentzea sp. BCCO 10_0856]MDX8029661.1 methyltransferase domain-containing protein [Lentzea sp. BCCO 10_0856]